MNPRQLAFTTLRSIQKGAFADVAVDQALHQFDLNSLDRRLFTELVYGTVRRQRTLNELIDQFAKKKDQPPDLRLILQLGLYQLRYLDQIPESAAVDTTVELAKKNKLSGLTGVVNGILRQYLRSQLILHSDPLKLPDDAIEQLGMLHSYPDWIVQVWFDQFGREDTAKLCEWMNQPPRIDLHINTLKTTLEQVESAIPGSQQIPTVPNALRLPNNPGAIQNLPGYSEGWWIVQDSSAQLVSYLVDPQPGEIVADACAAPGGKTMHLAELMQDQGTVWAIDKTPSRLKKLQQNLDRLNLTSIQILTRDSRNVPDLKGKCDRVLVDAPCSGLGTLNRHADARWRQTPESTIELAQIQQEILSEAASWVKPQGILVYSTCTLNPIENEAVIEKFLAQNQNWTIERSTQPVLISLTSQQGWIKVLPHCHNMDGFFMVRLKKI
ncbi:MAG: 16S rRNA (cytosine(967)-C(5))-methyltransferase [Leptolyngbya sp. Prado105]|nr:16S rRNA (cytosine(967)-C(5))-methyltransferase [Leptolyngbya sp. Prado105]